MALEEEIKYPKDFPKEEFDKEVKRLLQINYSEICKSDLIKILSGILTEKFNELNGRFKRIHNQSPDSERMLKKIADMYFNWTDPRFLNKIMFLKYGNRIPFKTLQDTIYRSLAPSRISGF